MHVALISPLFESVPPRLYGGTERVIHLLCRGLARAGVDVTLFASGDSLIDGELVPVIDEALRLRKHQTFDPIAYNFKMLAEVAERAEEFDVIHNHHDYWMLPLSRMASTPLLTTLHGRLDLPDLRAAFINYPGVGYISISDSQRAGLPDLRWLRTIYHGMDLETLTFHPRPGQYLAFLGRISAEKRPEWAIAIARAAGVPLRIAAKIDGTEGQAYFDAHVRPHVDGRNVEFVGEISEREKPAFLGNALALVFPIDWPEPFGLVVTESLACGTPVLARPCGAVPELLRDGLTGFVESDIRKLARRVADIPSIDRGECRRWVETRFSLERMTEEYIHVYRHLASFGRARAARQHGSDRYRRYLVHSVERAADRNT